MPFPGGVCVIQQRRRPRLVRAFSVVFAEDFAVAHKRDGLATGTTVARARLFTILVKRSVSIYPIRAIVNGADVSDNHLARCPKVH